MASHLTVATCNISGLKSDTKRHTVFNWLRSQKCDIIFLQGTHCHLKKDEYRWSREWDGQSIWSRGTNKSRGVAVLFSRKYNFDIVDKTVDSNGRYIIFTLKIGENVYKLINIYAPNDDFERVKFFQNINSWIDDKLETFIGGDFNCTLNSYLDRRNCVNSRDLGKVDLIRMMNSHNMEDIWRRRHPNDRTFSWRRGDKSSRIDYWLISDSLDGQLDMIEYTPCSLSDHNMCKMLIRTSETDHGPGIWKMNTSVVKSRLFKQCFSGMWDHWRTKKIEFDNCGI